MRPGQPVEIKIDAYPDQVFEGVVDSFAPASGSEFSLLPPENATGNFTKIVRRVPVKITFQPGTDLSSVTTGAFHSGQGQGAVSRHDNGNRVNSA